MEKNQIKLNIKIKLQEKFNIIFMEFPIYIYNIIIKFNKTFFKKRDQRMKKKI